MVIFILEHVTPSVRGELSRWFIEPHAGIFVGNISAMVREKLWEYLQKKSPNCAITLLHNAKTEQGFTIRTYGDTTRKVVDFEGISLIKKIESNQTKK
jgi:CRISPR-associated protein Cas2